MSRAASAALCLFACGMPAWADPATPEGAAGIESALRRYLGQAPGVVSVEPISDSYRATFDFAPLVAQIKMPGLTYSGTPFEVQLLDLGEGRWQVFSEGPMSASVRIAGFMSYDVKIADSTHSGVYNTGIASFETLDGEVRSMELEQVVTQPGQPKQTTRSTVETIRSSLTAVAGLGGGVDSKIRYESEGFDQTATFEAPGRPAVTITAQASGVSYDIEATGARNAALLEAVAYFVAHPSADALKADEAGMKSALRASLPIFDRMFGTMTVSDLDLGTPLGAFGVEMITVELEANGLGSDGKLREKVKTAGLTIPDALVPPWAMPLVPHEVSFDIGGAGFDPGAAIRLLLDTLSFGAKPPQGFDKQMLAALLPDGRFTVLIGPGGATTNEAMLEFDGEMRVGPDLPPLGKGRVVLTGMDAILKHLNEAPPDVGGQAAAGLLMMRGIARAEGDGLAWEIEATEDGKVLINGGDISGLMRR